MSRRVRGLRIVPAVGDPGVVRVGRVDIDRRWVPRRRVRSRRIVVDPVENHRGGNRVVRILRNEDAPGPGCRPERVRVARSALRDGDEDALAVGAVSRAGQTAVGSWIAERLPVVAGVTGQVIGAVVVDVREVSVPDVAVGPVLFLGGEDRIAAIVLRAEEVLAAGEQPSDVHRIADGGHDERRRLQGIGWVRRRIRQRVRDPVRIVLLHGVVPHHELARLECRQGPEAVRAGGIESVRPAVRDVDLQPVVLVPEGLPGPVVLGARSQPIRIVAVVIEGIRRQRAQAAVDGRQRLRYARKHHQAEGDAVGDHEVVRERRAVRAVVDEDAVRAVYAAVAQVEELPPVERVDHQRVVVRMQRARIDAAAVVLGHVGEGRAAVGREQDRPAVRAAGGEVVLVVRIRAREVHDVVIRARVWCVLRVCRGVHVVVVRALRLAVREAELLEIDPRRLDGSGRGGPDRVVPAQACRICAGAGVVAAASASVHARLSAGQDDDVKLVSFGGRAAEADESSRQHDLLPGPGVAITARPPDPAGEERCIDGVPIDRVELDPAGAARRAGGLVERDGVGRGGGAEGICPLVHQRPTLALVLRAPDAEVRCAGHQGIGAAAAGVGDAARRAAGGDEDRLRVARLHLDGADAAAEELRRAERAAPPFAAILRLVDADPDLAAAAAGVRLAGAGPDGLVVGVVGIELERRDALVFERARDKLPARPFVLGCRGIVDGERVVRPPDAAVRGGDPERALPGRRLAVRRDDAVRGPAAEVLRSRSVDRAIAEEVRQIVLPVGRSEGHPLSGAERRPPEQAEPIVARGGERGERRRSVARAIDGMLDPVLLRITLGAVA